MEEQNLDEAKIAEEEDRKMLLAKKEQAKKNVEQCRPYYEVMEAQKENLEAIQKDIKQFMYDNTVKDGYLSLDSLSGIRLVMELFKRRASDYKSNLELLTSI